MLVMTFFTCFRNGDERDKERRTSKARRKSQKTKSHDMQKAKSHDIQKTKSHDIQKTESHDIQKKKLKNQIVIDLENRANMNQSEV